MKILYQYLCNDHYKIGFNPSFDTIKLIFLKLNVHHHRYISDDICSARDPLHVCLLQIRITTRRVKVRS